MTSEKCLAKGPETRKARGTVVLEVVCNHAEKLWFRKELLRGNQRNTPEEIVFDVNEELSSLGQRPLMSPASVRRT
jgi:hypothetical protein